MKRLPIDFPSNANFNGEKRANNLKHEISVKYGSLIGRPADV